LNFKNDKRQLKTKFLRKSDSYKGTE